MDWLGWNELVWFELGHLLASYGCCVNMYVCVCGRGSCACGDRE